MTTHVSYCRLCPALCGTLVDVENDTVVRVRADTANASSAGYSCIKGRNAPAAHNHPDRILRHLRKRPDGEFETISLQAAVDDIGERLQAILAETGPESVGSYWGTYAWRATATLPIAKAWWEAIGSHKTFSPITIDQASKTVTYGRTGAYVGGLQRLEDADVWMEVGGNQLVSLQSAGWSNTNPTVNLRDERKRGLKLIVVDPRRTELARSADIHLQVRPGTDAVLLSAFLHVIFAEGLDRPEFWERYARNVDALRDHVRATTPAVAAQVCDVPEEAILAAARMFGHGRRGMANGHTGTDMGPGGNPCEHLLHAINIVCGRFAVEGDEVRAATLTGQGAAPRARVVGPYRKWESGWRSRLGYGLLPSPHSHFGELPATLLAEEILAPGEDRVRALFSIGGNPINAIPDTRRQVEAIKALDLMVTLDAFPTETARLADYVIAPTMMYERADFAVLNGTFGMYSAPVVPAPGDTVEEWEFFWRLGAAQGLDMRLGEGASEGVGAFAAIPPGRPGPLSGEPPTGDAVLGMIADNDELLELLKQNPRGYAAPPRSVTVLGPLDSDGQDRLDLFPPEFPEEMAELGRVLEDSARRRYRLVVRRSKETFNGTGKNLPGLNKGGTNPLHVHPADLAELGLVSGDRVVASSDHGAIRAVTRSDDSLRPGVVALTHGWGGLEDEDPFAPGVGANVNNLTSTRGPSQHVLRMPIMSALPVDIVPIREAPDAPAAEPPKA